MSTASGFNDPTVGHRSENSISTAEVLHLARLERYRVDGGWGEQRYSVSFYGDFRINFVRINQHKRNNILTVVLFSSRFEINIFRTIVHSFLFL